MINKKKIHNYKTGFLNYCQICNSYKITEVFNLGFQPLADDLREEKNRYEPLISYPISIYFCSKCVLLQNNYIVGDKNLYKKNYHYRPGISKSVVENQLKLAKQISNDYKLSSEELIIDIGSNDGTLLNQFKNIGFKNLLGVEPTNTIKFQNALKINSIKSFYNLNVSKKINKTYGKAKLILTTNVFAHSNKVADFIKSVKNNLKKNGIFVIENHYLLDVIKTKQFDTFYHEHLRTYSLKSLIILLGYYGFKIIHARTSERYGGNIQAHFALKDSDYRVTKNVYRILQKEKKFKLHKIKTYRDFKNKIDLQGKHLQKFLEKNKKKKIVAKAFPARAAVILHYYSFLKKYISYIAEQKTSLKLNKYVAGSNLKIINSEIMKKQKPDIIIILAWHLFLPILNKWRGFGLKKSKYIKILPKLMVK